MIWDKTTGHFHIFFDIFLICCFRPAFIQRHWYRCAALLDFCCSTAAAGVGAILGICCFVKSGVMDEQKIFAKNLLLSTVFALISHTPLLNVSMSAFFLLFFSFRTGSKDYFRPVCGLPINTYFRQEKLTIRMHECDAMSVFFYSFSVR